VSLKWEPGTNANVTVSIVGSTCTVEGLDGIAGQTTTFNDTVRIKNEGSKTATFNITVTKCQGSTNKLTSIYVKIYNSTDLVDTLTVWDGGIGDPLTGLSIASNEEWTLAWVITWESSATTTDYVDIELTLDVKS